MSIKNKVSIVTYQEYTDPAIANICARVRAHGPYYFETASKIESLPRPARIEDIQKILQEVHLPYEKWSGVNFKPKCDLCEEEHDWVLVIYEALEYEYPMDLHMCSDCLHELMEKKVEFLEETLEELKDKVGEV